MKKILLVLFSISLLSVTSVSNAKSILKHTLSKSIVPLNLTESDIIKSQKSAVSGNIFEKNRAN